MGEKFWRVHLEVANGEACEKSVGCRNLILLCSAGSVSIESHGEDV